MLFPYLLTSSQPHHILHSSQFQDSLSMLYESDHTRNIAGNSRQKEAEFVSVSNVNALIIANMLVLGSCLIFLSFIDIKCYAIYIRFLGYVLNNNG